MAQKELNIMYKFKEPGQESVDITEIKEICSALGPHQIAKLSVATYYADTLIQAFEGDGEATPQSEYEQKTG